MKPDRPAWEALQTLPRPVAALASDYPPGHRIAPHRHPRAQLIFASSGVVTVTTAAGTWVVPPQRAVWMPAGTEHRIRAGDAPIAMRTLYIEPDAAPGLPSGCRVLAVSPLLRELIMAAMTRPRLYRLGGPDDRLMAVLLDQIGSAREARLHLPTPRDSRLLVVAEGLAEAPGDRRRLADWAAIAGASARTLARLFRRDTGMSFDAWRRQLRLQTALTWLAVGRPVTTVALDLGYDSPSAFIAMFRRALGQTPGQYFAKGERSS